jgi:hypothetical protein
MLKSICITIGRITQPVVNFLLAKLALNAEIYMYNDWAHHAACG